MQQLSQGVGIGSGRLRLSDAHEGIDAAEEDVNGLAGQLDLAVLRGDETIFHDMGHLHAVLDADNACRPLDGVGGAHQGFEQF